MTYKEAKTLIDSAKTWQNLSFINHFDAMFRKALTKGLIDFQLQDPNVSIREARDIIQKQYPDIEFNITETSKYRGAPRYFHVTMVGERK